MKHEIHEVEGLLSHYGISVIYNGEGARNSNLLEKGYMENMRGS